MWRGAKIRNFDPIAYENYYFWLNNIVREWGMFDHGIGTKLVDGLCGCFDCARSVQIIQEYVNQYGGNVVDLMNRMVKATDQVLSKEPHGFRPDVLPSDKWTDAAQKLGESWVRRHLATHNARQRAVQYVTPKTQSHVRPPT